MQTAINCSTKTLAIAALARDCAGALKRNIPKVEKLRSFFADSFVVVVENDSIDGTKELLADWAARSPGVTVLSHDTHKATIPAAAAGAPRPMGSLHRNGRMAAFRNTYLAYLREHHPAVDYLLVIDSDIDGFDEEAIPGVIAAAPEDWAALFANGVKFLDFGGHRRIGRYYDEYALVPDASPELSGLGDSCLELTLAEMKRNRDHLSRSLRRTPYVPCISAFGGLGIYRYQYLKDAAYTIRPNSRNPRAESICEHILLNAGLRTYGRCYTARDLRVYHNGAKDPKDFFLDFLPTSLWLFLYRIFKWNIKNNTLWCP